MESLEMSEICTQSVDEVMTNGAVVARTVLSLGEHGRIGVFKTAGLWRARVRIRDYDGVIRQVQGAGRSRDAAERALQRALRDRQMSALGDLLSPRSKFSEAAEKWYSELTELSPSTMQAYRVRLDKTVLPALGNVRVHELSVGLIDRHLKAVKTRHGAAAAKQTKTVLSGVCGLLARHDAIATNPVRDVARVSTLPKHPPMALSVAQLRDVVTWFRADEVAQSRDLPDLVAFLAGTGLRIGEACALTWADVDLEEATVHVHGTVLRIRGVGLVVGATKSRAGQRTIELPSWLVELLRARRGEADRPVFPAPLSGGWRDPSNTSHWVKDGFMSMGLCDFTSHTFRKSVASILSDSGVSPRIMADQLGHARPSLSLDVYLGRSKRVRGASGALEQVGAVEGAARAEPVHSPD
ncbi:site-specific integrase [Amnibacterium sp. CER49]|uniref:tyrosine-type recombinase/integrase n=1 Tax=Amnibacterium sp. CER49 TaxID=3039161 RepID=UPI002446CC33|nr:site-specific integrase [Amnibacterium sp. CER49]MDH2442398.1 site-specific integrase [Amnibacterium sp. CER49]